MLGVNRRTVLERPQGDENREYQHAGRECHNYQNEKSGPVASKEEWRRGGGQERMAESSVGQLTGAVFS